MYNIKTHSKSGTLFSKKKMSNKIERGLIILSEVTTQYIYTYIYPTI